MGTLAIGFLVAWVGVAAYVGWLGVQQRRLSERLEEVERRDEAGRVRKQSRAA